MRISLLETLITAYEVYEASVTGKQNKFYFFAEMG